MDSISRRMQEMEISRTFLGWDGPVLPRVVNWLGLTYGNESTLDLNGVCIVVPGSRAGRRLLELLVVDAEDRGLVFLPPRIKTVGDLPELLYQPKRPFADRLTQHLAWLHVVRDCDQVELRRFVRQIPDDGRNDEGNAAAMDLDGWLRLARLLWRQHRELAGDGLSFQDVVDYGHVTPAFQDTARWQFLWRLQQAYLAQLDTCQLWDRQTARLFAIEHGECHTDSDIILVAMSDVNRATRLMLDLVADRVTALIAAPSELEPRFERYGCLISATWSDALIELDDAQIRLVDGSQGQVAAVAEIVAGYGGRYRADEVTIGLPDASLAPCIENGLAEHGLPTRVVAGRPIRETAVFRLVTAIADYLRHGDYDSFAAVLRHPDVPGWLDALWEPTGKNSLALLPQLDQFQNRVLPVQLVPRSISSERYPLVRDALVGLEELVLPLRHSDAEPNTLPLNQWPGRIAPVLENIYGATVVDRRDPERQADLAAISRIHEALLSLQEIPATLAPAVTGSQAIGCLLQLIESENFNVAQDADSLAMLGWLELPLDTSPALIVTSFNEEFLPESLDSDLFMPNRLRQELGLVDNIRRYARDAYALSLLAQSRETLSVIVARRDREGNPLKPSRLLFATDAETMARRAIAAFRPQEEATKMGVAGPNGGSTGMSSIFAACRPPPLDKPVTTMTVTSFRSYLACPYRFYLCHVAKFEAVDDRLRELDAPQFGSLIHEVLCRFGQHAVRDSEDEHEIREFLDAELRKCTQSQFGTRRLPAVNLQITQAGARLHAFAAWQSAWVREGWRIRHTEVPDGNRTVDWKTADKTIHIRGRIDRIDYHESTRRWMVFDYKTGDTAKRPEQTHRADGKWIDLQLPLYRHIVKLLGITEPVSLGYILLPKDPGRVGHYCADWSAAELKTADAKVDEVIRSVLAERFWPPAVPVPRTMREFAPLCNEGILA